jgi:hypothetical protein
VSVSEIEGLPYATRKRCICIKLAKSLVAYKIISEQVIISAFKKTGIFPVSFDYLIANDKTLRDTSEEVLTHARATVQTDVQAWEYLI